MRYVHQSARMKRADKGSKRMHLKCSDEPMQIEGFEIIAHSTKVTPRRFGASRLILETLKPHWLRNALRDPFTYIQNAPQRLVGSNVIAAIKDHPDGFPRHLQKLDMKLVALGTLYRDKRGKPVFMCLVGGHTFSYFWPENLREEDDCRVLCLKGTALRN
jgi:hypothetical protein